MLITEFIVNIQKGEKKLLQRRSNTFKKGSSYSLFFVSLSKLEAICLTISKFIESC
jgi:hypothetical protein